MNVEIEEIAVTEFLVIAKLLDPLQRDDRAALSSALGRLITIAVGEELK